MTELIFATNNQNKVAEINKVAGNRIKVITMADAGFTDDIPEPYDTLEQNAFTKSLYIYLQTGKPSFSEDTGLEIFSLNGEPGVRSARYAGEPGNAKKNTELVLEKLKKHSDRSARFRTVISLIIDKVEYQFEGICPGRIIEIFRGEGGFGYDPVFVPDGSESTFGEMSMDQKNIFSHRKKATEKLIRFLNKYYGEQ